jgi:hypothetical protein
VAYVSLMRWKVTTMTRTARIGLLAALATLVVLATACGASPPQPTPSPSPSAHGELPPPWVQNEVAWQSLAAGDPHPKEAEWVLTKAHLAAPLAGRQTSYLKAFKNPMNFPAYVVLVRGRFHHPNPLSRATSVIATGAMKGTLYLVIGSDSHYYFAQGLTATPPHLKQLPAMHTYIPVLPTSSRVWGHTMVGGGPAPGGPTPIHDIPVAVYAGLKASGAPITMVRSDADGFFALDLPPGIYTFRMTSDDHGFPIPASVKVRAGQTVAAGVYGEEI